MADVTLSKVTEHLKGLERQRYLDKLVLIGIDPYALSDKQFSPLLPGGKSETIVRDYRLPNFQFGDLWAYLIERQSAYTKQSLKGFKSLGAYKYFVAGFVHDVQMTKTTINKYLVVSKVTHSQKLNDPPLRPWIACHKDGEVIASLCTCKAGLGEVCSHVAATLFLLEAVVKRRQDTACTSLPCEWIKTAGAKGQYKPGVDIDFTSSHFKKTKLDADEPIETPCSPTSTACIPSVTNDKAQLFYAALKASGTKSAVLSLVESFADDFIPDCLATSLPAPLTQLTEGDMTAASDEELNAKCSNVYHQIMVTSDQSRAIEKMTRKQARISLWHEQRAGRLTASKFKAIASTKVDNPSSSLLKAICYPHSAKFSTPATRYGCQHEKDAADQYEKLFKPQHRDFKLTPSGLHIHPHYSHLGATPDDLIECTCCGKGVLEVKCPFCKRDETVEAAAQDKTFCLQEYNGVIFPKRTHKYFYQVQGQMILTNRHYSDFVVWTGSLHIERINLDLAFDNELLPKLLTFFQHCVLAELVARFWTRQRAVKDVSVYCYCRSTDDKNDIVVCSNVNCRIVKFHFACLGLKRKTNRMWSCLECKKQMNIERKSAKKETVK